MISIIMVVSKAEQEKIIKARILKAEMKATRMDINFEAKEYSGSYADDDKECNHSIINMGVCAGCGERRNDI